MVLDGAGLSQGDSQQVYRTHPPNDAPPNDDPTLLQVLNTRIDAFIRCNNQEGAPNVIQRNPYYTTMRLAEIGTGRAPNFRLMVWNRGSELRSPPPHLDIRNLARGQCLSQPISQLTYTYAFSQSVFCMDRSINR